jgi:hypothetical protein
MNSAVPVPFTRDSCYFFFIYKTKQSKIRSKPRFPLLIESINLNFEHVCDILKSLKHGRSE